MYFLINVKMKGLDLIAKLSSLLSWIYSLLEVIHPPLQQNGQWQNSFENLKNSKKYDKKLLNKSAQKGQLKDWISTNSLPYLRAVVKETLRLRPAAPLLLPRKALNDTEMFGYTVPKNSQVFVNAWAIGRDPKSWVRPLEFLPQRFIESSVDYKGRDFEYIPFGAGRRICTGMKLAIWMVNLMLASVIQPFNWKLPKGMAPENLDME
ncbi:hypothetical protein RND71_005875 [Anisodus tanguticus]|uniref:Cytochrome P450 76AD1-like protein n=1 Tax=Anisodus tanguticus TaxID=243964 RepID=A0AAE1STA6_9SOLA|nr:hypothetical protein RND71_005875 [Anisodus tanguticus]